MTPPYESALTLSGRYWTMSVTTRLTWKEEQSLRKLLGNVSLSLLFKSSVHTPDISDLIQRCSHQGSMLMVIYSAKHIFGFFILEHFPKLHESSEKPCTSFYFSLEEKNNIIETPTLFLSIKVRITNGSLEFYSSEKLIFFLNPRGNCYEAHNLFGKQKNNLGSRYYSECEVFRVEGIKNSPDYIKKIVTAPPHRNRLLADLRAYKPYSDLVPEIRILLLGPVGSGKSSFCNSVKSVFHGHPTRQAIVGSDNTSISEQYRIYSVKDGKDGQYLPFMLCDSMGLEETDRGGLHMDDIPYILKGCVPDRYQFNPYKPITAQHPNFVTSPSLKERIHCVAYVLDISSVDNLSFHMVAKLKQIHREVKSCGIAHVALLTKVNCDEVLQDNFLNMRHMSSQSQVMNVNKMLGIPISNILMVGNYALEKELDPVKDILILSVLRQMLRAADDFLEDLLPGKTDDD